MGGVHRLVVLGRTQIGSDVHGCNLMHEWVGLEYGDIL
jgi:hypothetical protein